MSHCSPLMEELPELSRLAESTRSITVASILISLCLTRNLRRPADCCTANPRHWVRSCWNSSSYNCQGRCSLA